MLRKTPESWRDLQESVAVILREAGFVAEVERSTNHARGVVELDVYAEHAIQSHVVTLACECKQWKTAVPQAVVQTFRTILSDTGIDAGYIVSAAGFQSGAIQAATYTNVRLVDWAEFLAIFAPEGPPLALGLRASAEIVSGAIQLDAPDGGVLPWMADPVISSGSIHRLASGGLKFSLETKSAMPALQATNEQIGFKGFTLCSKSDVLSTTASQPTLLNGTVEFQTPAGMPALNPMTGDKMVLPATRCRLDVSASCVLEGLRLLGTWSAAVEFNGLRLPFKLAGSFKVRLL